MTQILWIHCRFITVLFLKRRKTLKYVSSCCQSSFSFWFPPPSFKRNPHFKSAHAQGCDVSRKVSNEKDVKKKEEKKSEKGAKGRKVSQMNLKWLTWAVGERLEALINEGTCGWSSFWLASSSSFSSSSCVKLTKSRVELTAEANRASMEAGAGGRCC